ncbi:hypothetical protein BJP40_02230 [Streptomyces sp. CC53]|uniref:hypothetical protein n=1 Tax=unclassified Streptomyces TaxID=2593676 RepID=UPI0008DC8B9E|nr:MULTISPECIES: hypothetical protein [unclassified Streptomyces]OII64353.1 hypothetical protein BJP40_02230 [Streptomyces sp. CC53]
MHHSPEPAAGEAAAVFKRGDFVLYRDPSRFWAGEPGHTFPCRVEKAWASGDYELTELKSLRPIYGALPQYMRLLPPADAMRDIDTAPLNGEGALEMTSAAMAWLARQDTRSVQGPRRAELPPQRG